MIVEHALILIAPREHESVSCVSDLRLKTTPAAPFSHKTNCEKEKCEEDEQTNSHPCHRLQIVCEVVQWLGVEFFVAVGDRS